MDFKQIFKTSFFAAAMTCSLMPGTDAFCDDYKMGPGEREAGAEENQPASLFQILDEKVALSALVELEYYNLDGYEGAKESDLSLATVELGMEAELNDWVNGWLLALYEDGESLTIDEAIISIGNSDESPFFMNGGLMYVPFGYFETSMIQDPLTHSLGETGDSALEIGFEVNGMRASVYGFRSDIKETGADDEINTFGASAGYLQEGEEMSVDVGVDYINNMAGSGAHPDFVPEEIASYVAGIGAHVMFSYGPVAATISYVAAQDDYQSSELAFGDDVGAQPEAMTLEAAFTTEIGGKETTFAAGYQTSSEAVALELPETRYLASVGVGIMDYTSLTAEYLHDEDYTVADGGTGDNADQISVRLGLEF